MDLEGVFYASVVRPKSWFEFGRTDKRDQAARADSLFKRFAATLEAEVAKSPDGAFARLSRAPLGALSPRQTAAAKVQKYLRGVDGQCAVTVLPGANAITGHLIHLAPYVHADSRFLICFFGYLSNLAELQECSGVLEVDDIGTATTQTILALYQRFMNLHKGGSQREELLLSELQGHYAFFLYDEQGKQALAARDPSGQQELFWAVDPDDGSVAFTNSLNQLPTGEAPGRWREVPPGHYVSGRTPVLRQFALTPEQLEERHERHESTNLDLSDEEISQEGSPRPASAAMNLIGRISKKHSK